MTKDLNQDKSGLTRTLVLVGNHNNITVADPGFPLGGGANFRHASVLEIFYVKTKESEPLGGACRLRPLGSANVTAREKYCKMSTN